MGRGAGLRSSAGGLAAGGSGGGGGVIRAFVVTVLAWCVRPLVEVRAGAVSGGAMGACRAAGMWVWRRVRELASLDTRSLALFRVLLALSTLWDLFNRMRDLKAHYADDGILSRNQVIEYGLHNWYWTSAYMVAGFQPFVFAVFCVNALFLTAFLVGYKTFWVNLVCWWMLVGLQGRNILVGHAGDCLHRILLLVAAILPTARHFSADAVLAARRRARDDGANPAELSARPLHNLAFGLPAVALISEFIMMYYTAYWHKSGDEWRVKFTAAWLALQLEFFARPLAQILIPFPAVCSFFTWAVHRWQWWGNWGLISPIFFGPARLFCAIGWQCMHLGFATMLRLGVFGWVTLTAPVCMYPAFFWDHIVLPSLATPQRRGLRVHYRRHCNTCGMVAHGLAVFGLHGGEMHADDTCGCAACSGSASRATRDSAQDASAERAERLLASSGGWLVVESPGKGAVYAGYDALVECVLMSPLLWPLTPVLLRLRWPMAPILAALHWHTGDGNSDTVDPLAAGACSRAVTRIRRARAQNPPLWREFGSLFFRVLKAAICNAAGLFFFYVIFSYNMSNIGVTQYGPGNSIRPWIWGTYTDQFWGVFAPRPPDSWWWYNFEATLANGSSAEIFAGGNLWSPRYTIPHTFEKPGPTDFYQGFKNHRWFKYFENGLNNHARSQDLRLNFGRWVCREFNGKYHGDSRLKTFNIWMVGDRLDPANMTAPRISTGRRQIWQHLCYDGA